MSPMSGGNYSDDPIAGITAMVSQSAGAPYRAVTARWKTALKLFPADFFSPKNPNRFKLATEPVKDLLSDLPKVTAKTNPKKGPGAPRKYPKSHRQEDLEWRLAVAGLFHQAPFRNINSLAEHLDKSVSNQSFKKHLYEYVENGKRLGRDKIDRINGEIRKYKPFPKSYDISKVPLKIDYEKEWEENEARHYRRVFIGIVLDVSDAVLQLQKRKNSPPSTGAPESPFPVTKNGWDELDVNDVQIQILKGYAPALAEGMIRGSVEFYVWWLAFEKLVKHRKTGVGLLEMQDAHESMLRHLLEPVAKEVPITRLQVVLGAPAVMP